MTEFIDSPNATGLEPASLAINGRSWPYTERLALPFGKAVTWRVINATFGTHPMHLHGTFYSVESLGDRARDTIYDHDSRRLVTTEAMAPGATMTMRWVPDRVGKWLFHCHIQAHVTGDLRAADAAPAPTRPRRTARTTSSARWPAWCSESTYCLAMRQRPPISAAQGAPADD